ncbi:hypothetical protein CASFOL_022662 [Castilleja foliolosa]|uniref:DUF4283 domain-containing protein n=1 Tax=Castilleja foliolosa TaxID=1961234 RepID=A0ABD3CV58_9LAMI
MAFEKNKGDNSNSKHVNLNEGSKFVPKTISELNSYLRSYENELKKVDAFKRELPLCMQFLKTEIEKLKEEEDDMSIEHSEKRTWMSSFQLWSTHVEYQQQQGYFSPSMCDEDDEAKPVDDEGTISGGLFGRPPQKKIKKKLRRCWSPELHRVFVHALDEIGGAERRQFILSVHLHRQPMSASGPALRPALQDNQTPPRSYAHIVNPSASVPIDTSWFSWKPVSTPIRNNNIMYKDEKPVCIISSLEIEQATKQLEYALIMKFTSGRPSLFDIRTHIKNHWKLAKDPIITLIDPRHVLVINENEEDMVIAQSQESHKINTSLYRIFKWSPDFNFNKDSTIVPVWISFPKLPFVLQNQGLLEKLGNTVGKFLRADEKTRNNSNALRPRICVELDVAKDFTTEIWVGENKDVGFWQNVEYEGNNAFCTHCGLLGHMKGICRKIKANNIEENRQDTRQVKILQRGQTMPTEWREKTKKKEETNQDNNKLMHSSSLHITPSQPAKIQNSRNTREPEKNKATFQSTGTNRFNALQYDLDPEEEQPPLNNNTEENQANNNQQQAKNVANEQPITENLPTSTEKQQQKNILDTIQSYVGQDQNQTPVEQTNKILEQIQDGEHNIPEKTQQIKETNQAIEDESSSLQEDIHHQENINIMNELFEDNRKAKQHSMDKSNQQNSLLEQSKIQRKLQDEDSEVESNSDGSGHKSTSNLGAPIHPSSYHSDTEENQTRKN